MNKINSFRNSYGTWILWLEEKHRKHTNKNKMCQVVLRAMRNNNKLGKGIDSYVGATLDRVGKEGCEVSSSAETRRK